MHEYIPENYLHNFNDLALIFGVVFAYIGATSFLISRLMNKRSKKRSSLTFIEDFIGGVEVGTYDSNNINWIKEKRNLDDMPVDFSTYEFDAYKIHYRDLFNKETRKKIDLHYALIDIMNKQTNELMKEYNSVVGDNALSTDRIEMMVLRYNSSITTLNKDAIKLKKELQKLL